MSVSTLRRRMEDITNTIPRVMEPVLQDACILGLSFHFFGTLIGLR